MNKEDREFFTTLIKGVEGKVDGLEGRFDGLEGRFDGLEDLFKVLNDQVGKNFEAIQENSMLIQKNSDGIRCLGVEFEDLKGDFTVFGEKQNIMDNRLQRVENNVKGIANKVSDYPEFRSTVISHSNMLAKLRR